MIQDAGAGDVVELPEAEGGNLEQRTVNTPDVAELADLGALPGDLHAAPADVEVYDLGVDAPQLLGQKNDRVSGTAPGNQDAQRTCERVAPPVAEVETRSFFWPSS